MQKIIKTCIGCLAVIFVLFAVFVPIISVSHAAETDTDSAHSASLLLDGVKAYEQGDYKRAIENFSALTSTGLRNGKLFYNLGNSYLKAGDIGRAILWYERAVLLIPGDADLEFNLDYARGLTKDQQEGRGLNIKRILFFWKYMLTDKTVQICAVFLNGLFWGLLLLRMFITTGRRSGVRRVSVVVGGLALVFALTAFYNYYESSIANEAIILPDEVVVRSGLVKDSTELFRLHAGSLVRLDRRQGEYARITFSKDMIGWIPIESVGVIRKQD